MREEERKGKDRWKIKGKKYSPVILHCVCVTVAVHVHEKKLYLWEITYMFMLCYVIKRKLQVDIHYLCIFQ